MSKARQLADLGNVYDDGALSNRNLIINGAMQVHQRGDQTGVTSTTNYFVDRFQLVATDEGTWSLTQEDDAPSGSGFIKSAKLEITTADSSIATGDYAQLRYKFENQDVKHLLKGTSNAKKCTLSFWVKSSIAQDYSLRLRESNSSTTRQNVKQFTVSAANTWQKETITFDGDTGGDDFSGAANASGNFILEWLLGGGTDFQGGTPNAGWEDVDATAFDATDIFLTTVNSTFYLTGVQLEVGDTATPFEHRSYGDELARCQRYLTQFTVLSGGERILIGAVESSTRSRHDMPLAVPMRATPTITTNGSPLVYEGSANRGFSNPQVTAVTNSLMGLKVDISSATSTNACMIRFNSASDYIRLDAEL